MEQNNQSIRKVIRVSKKKLIISFLIVVALGVLILIGTNRSVMRGYGIVGTGVNMMNAIPRIDFGEDYSYRNNYNQTSVKDTREFLKTNYSAAIKTKDVGSVMDRAENAIHKNDGRVDNYNKSDKYGSISFVIPKAKFMEFKTEMESFTHKKLYVETISSTNLLSQKQGIEANGAAIKKTVAGIQADLAQIKKDHVSRMDALNSQLSAEKAQNPTGAMSDWGAILQDRINSENNSYNALLASNAAQMSEAKNNLAMNKDQDVAFADNIETVSGNLSVNWVSNWEIFKIYSPIAPGWVIAIVVVIALAIAHRKKYIPSIELV